MADRWDELRVLSRDQFWLFTAAQARHRGFRTYELARAVEKNILVRVHHGVYAFVDADDWCLFEGVAAQWLALDPGADITERRAAPTVVVSHECAASLQDLGTIATYGAVDLTSPQRINVRNPKVRTHRRPIGEQGRDWHLFEGLPVATATRVISDLAERVVDGGDLGRLVWDCIDDGDITEAQACALLAPHAAKWGTPAGDGAYLLDVLRSSCRQPNYV